MTTITRWVLAHRRWVAAFWIVVTIVGIATVGQATKAFSSEFSVPGREGFETNSQIQRLFGQGGRTSPLVPVVTLPAGTSVSSPAVRAGLLDVQRRLQRAIPGLRTASYASTGNRAFVSADGRTTFVLAYPPPDNESFGNNTRAAKRPQAALSGETIAGAPVRVTGIDALQNQTGGRSGPGVLPRVGARRPRRAGRAGLRVRLAAGLRPAADGDRLDHDHLPGPVGRDRRDQRVDDRRVPRRADRAGRRHRLLAAGRRALARGARPRRTRATRRWSGRWRPPVARSCSAAPRCDRAAGDDRPAAAVPALDRLRRDADPADQRDRRHHAAAGRAGQGRQPARLAAPALR